MQLSNLKPNPNNPRIIKDDKFKKLVKSIEEFPEMMAKRPIVCVTDVDNKIYPLGGNMRLKALQELKYKDIPDEWVLMADEWTEEQRREFVIKDNVGFGEWDWEALQEWDSEHLKDWGLNLPDFNNIKFEPTLDPYTNYSDVTKEQILKEAEKLANQMLKTRKIIDCVCPDCGTEFEIDG